MANTFQSPVSGEPSGGTWHKFEDPTVGWFANKTGGWTADSFSGGLEVDFSSIVPAGTKAIRCVITNYSTRSAIYYRKSGDTNISNTPNASTEYSHRIMDSIDGIDQAELWLSSDYKVQFAVVNTATDVYVAFPVEYMI